ncbi:hypothetical protein GMRT_10763 [Giardia muris]|uniref:Uncharacterized protein n=1 Tax=Giardia muris TaxID=5742 RepID=A0A4Z1TDL7_GIAMU|nr:hypothetical protein GMRT_10763 [Giardia muris]|eukprot:TNJ30649.1 hypothetical protein GMRT_10763 [Giardia muris]
MREHDRYLVLCCANRRVYSLACTILPTGLIMFYLEVDEHDHPLALTIPYANILSLEVDACSQKLVRIHLEAGIILLWTDNASAFVKDIHSSQANKSSSSAVHTPHESVFSCTTSVGPHVAISAALIIRDRRLSIQTSDHIIDTELSQVVIDDAFPYATAIHLVLYRNSHESFTGHGDEALIEFSSKEEAQTCYRTLVTLCQLSRQVIPRTISRLYINPSILACGLLQS